mmetsp:Transcript_105404/g.191730  ORF Transcript_105404/g.191730 Transcript_105404/m.191730 type:complete len:101 (+) Transcript_105404:507-809(+)
MRGDLARGQSDSSGCDRRRALCWTPHATLDDGIDLGIATRDTNSRHFRRWRKNVFNIRDVGCSHRVTTDAQLAAKMYLAGAMPRQLRDSLKLEPTVTMRQ